jgi:hypothetical protein
MRNGLIDGTKCQSSEQKGNLFRLLCIAHTTNGSCVMKKSLSLSDTKWKQSIEFLKLYLGMEEWSHDSNNKVEVINARPQIAKVLWSLQHFFPRNSNPNGYKLPKMHGITNMQEYMMLFGSGINFHGEPGKSAHKQFIKITGQRTQQRVGEFAQQTALQYYKILVSSILRMTVRSNPIFTINQEILKQIWTLQNQKKTLSLECQESMISKLIMNWLKWWKQKAKVIVNWSYNVKILKGSLWCGKVSLKYL